MHQIIPRSSQKLHQILETGGTNNKTFGWIIMSYVKMIYVILTLLKIQQLIMSNFAN